MGAPEVNVHALDAAYKPFPTFAQWASKTSVDTVRWDRYNSALKQRPNGSDDALNRAREIVKRAAALDTGAIEGLYEVDRGFTFTVALETAAWEVKLAEKGAHVRPLFEAQMHAYDYVLDLATKAEPISEAAIRTLHEVVCKAQATYRVMTAIGPQEQELVKGRYKVLPNHVRTRDGLDHSYAPVDVTPAEMQRLIEEMRGEAFLAAHPVIQAAYAHYGLVVIHPFADGNGRVARALASTFTYRAISTPVMILSEHKSDYLDSLEAADAGEFQSFVDFMLRRSIDTMVIVSDSIRETSVPSIEESLAAINGPKSRSARYSNRQIDEGGARFLSALTRATEKEISDVAVGKIQGKCGVAAGAHRTYLPKYRPSQNIGQHFYLELLSVQPSWHSEVSLPPAVVKREYDLYVPVDADQGNEYLLKNREGNDEMAVPVEDAIPILSATLQIRIDLFADRIVRELLADLGAEVERANQRLR
ncbi:MAG: Fic family protein [Terracidiphilus sp.]|nr:Fic family protein [Terracidiphilus sp.]